ncbi:MAG: HAD family hydrolase [Oscillochloris sp.]|nr:HAD family hydrolase [Oscillochloris sp.]
MRAILLDRDGVINENRDTHVTCWEEFQFLPGALTALRWLYEADFQVFIVTNQAIVGRGIVTRQGIDDIHDQMRATVAAAGGWISAVRYCPHDACDACDCRKPQPGMLFDLAHTYAINLQSTFMIGDALTDIGAAHAAGCRSVLVRTGRGAHQMTLPGAAQYRPDFVADNVLDAVRLVIAGSEQPRIQLRGAAD